MKKKRDLPLAIAISIISCAETNCNTTAIELAQIPTTGGSISESGNYYLGCDVPGGAITIAHDQVTLNLNGHTIGQIVISGRKDVIVTNGIVDGSSLTMGGAISVSESDNVHLSNLAALYTGANTNIVNGIGISITTNLFLSHILVEGFSSAGCSMESGSTRVFISDCVFSNNGSQTVNADPGRVGLLINDNNKEVTVRRCLAIANRTDGFLVSANSEKIYLFDCIARENGRATGLESSTSNGFHGFQGSSPPLGPVTFVAIRCIAEDNAQHGFFAQTGAGFIFESCTAHNNLMDGFDAQGDKVGLVKECTATSNTRCGFNNLTGAASLATYVANYASDNSIANYCTNNVDGSGSLPYKSLTFDNGSAQFWRNITP